MMRMVTNAPNIFCSINSFSFVLFVYSFFELINDLSLFDHSQLFPGDFFNIPFVPLQPFYFLPQLLILLLQLYISILDLGYLLLEAKEVQNPLFPKESEGSKNQKGNNDQKKKTFLFHFKFQMSDFRFLNPQSLPAADGRDPQSIIPLLQFKFYGNGPPLFNLWLLFGQGGKSPLF